jgi:hypothetical protein
MPPRPRGALEINCSIHLLEIVPCPILLFLPIPSPRNSLSPFPFLPAPLYARHLFHLAPSHHALRFRTLYLPEGRVEVVGVDVQRASSCSPHKYVSSFSKLISICPGGRKPLFPILHKQVIDRDVIDREV